MRCICLCLAVIETQTYIKPLSIKMLMCLVLPLSLEKILGSVSLLSSMFVVATTLRNRLCSENLRNEEVDPKVYGKAWWVDLWLDNLELIWIMWALIILWPRCKHGIMQSGAIGIIGVLPEKRHGRLQKREN